MTLVRRRLAIAFVFVLLVVVLSGCRKKRPFILQPSTRPRIDMNIQDPDDDTEDTNVTPVITGEAYNLIMVHFYTVDAASASVKSATVMEREDVELTPERVLGYLADSLEDESVTLNINSATENNGNIIVDFDDSIKIISQQSADLELAVLDAAAQSILDNIKCGSIIFRIGGEAYRTANLSFGIDYSYMDY